MISQPDKLRIVGLWNSTELQAIVYTKVIKKFYIFINAIKYTFTPIYIQGKNMTEIYFKSLRSGCFRLPESLKNYINACEGEFLIMKNFVQILVNCLKKMTGVS